MKQKCDELGIEIRFGWNVQSFIQDDHAKVIIVQRFVKDTLKSDDAKETTHLYASKAVIVASGGFVADREFLKDIIKNDSFLTINKKSTSAEVLKACMAINAATIHLDQIQWMPWTTQDESGYGKGALFGDYIVASYGIGVDCTNGKRFGNEMGNRRQLTEAMLKRKDVIEIVDSASVKKMGWKLEDALKKGVLQAHRDINQLARHYAIPYESLIKTIEDYNLCIKLNTSDPFGKKFET